MFTTCIVFCLIGASLVSRLDENKGEKDVVDNWQRYSKFSKIKILIS